MDPRTESGELVVGVRILDCDHREMTEAIMELQTAVEKEVDRSRTNALLRRLAHFTFTHFALEEGMMDATQYPGVNLHSHRHQHMLSQIREIIASHRRGSMELNRDALGSLLEAHSSHVQYDDLLYGHWLNKVGKR